MIINKSKKMFLPLFKQHINISEDPYNTYMFTDELELYTLVYKFKTSLIKTGYESYGFLKYDKYLLNHRLFVNSVDFLDYTAYKFSVPTELIPAYYKAIKGDYNSLYNTEKVLVDEKSFVSLENYKTYETF